jgi:hypothetical protein
MASMKMAVFWVLSASLTRAIALLMTAANTSESLVNFYQKTQRNNPEGSHLQKTLKLSRTSMQRILSILNFFADDLHRYCRSQTHS